MPSLENKKRRYLEYFLNSVNLYPNWDKEEMKMEESK